MASLGRCLLFAVPAALALWASPGRGEVLPFRFRGTVDFVTGATDTTADLTASIQVGSSVILDYALEMTTVGEPGGPLMWYDALVSLNLQTAGLSWTAKPDAASYVSVGNNFFGDSYALGVVGLAGDQPGGAEPFGLDMGVRDTDGSAWSSTDLPRDFGALAQYETRELTLRFLHRPTFKFGTIRVILTEGGTPVHPLSWGGIKVLAGRGAAGVVGR